MMLHALAGCTRSHRSFGTGQRDGGNADVPCQCMGSSLFGDDGGAILPGPHHLGPEELLDLMESEQVTLALGVPTIWMMIQGALENPSRPRRFFKGMRMLVGGAAPPAAMIAAFDRFDMHILQVWGMTVEAGSRFTAAGPTTCNPRHAGSRGAPCRYQNCGKRRSGAALGRRCRWRDTSPRSLDCGWISQHAARSRQDQCRRLRPESIVSHAQKHPNFELELPLKPKISAG
jgi:acyl-CoA synthetase (AMP-forming)/AMP-acid ligase II